MYLWSMAFNLLNWQNRATPYHVLYKMTIVLHLTYSGCCSLTKNLSPLYCLVRTDVVYIDFHF